MQGVIARAALCPKARRATFGRPAARVRHVPRGLSGGGGKSCVAAAAGERGRDVPGVADQAVAPPSGARRGSVAGAVALIVGTSIGSGILAVPQRTAPAVSFPSSAHTPPSASARDQPDKFTVGGRGTPSTRRPAGIHFRDPLPQVAGRCIDEPAGERCCRQDNDFPN